MLYEVITIDRQPDPRRFRDFSQLDEAGRQLNQGPLALGIFVARMQRRQLDRNPRPVDRPLAFCFRADPLDGRGIGFVSYNFV